MSTFEHETVLHYQIHELLGTGGSGVVYRATDTKLDRPVALKFLHDGLRARGEAVERLRLEARASARLDHPNIGSIYAIETGPDGKVFISMAFYQGETLAELLDREGRLPFRRALDIAIQILRGLEQAHRAGIVHRDVKPGNVFVLPDGLVKILDFGIAKAADALELTEAGAMLGTVEYMSPQQVRGQDVDHRADVWSAGVVLYKMLHGASPFSDGDNPFAVIYGIASRTPQKLTRLHPELPAGIDAVIERALGKSLEERYGSAAEFLQDLQILRDLAPPDDASTGGHPGAGRARAGPGGAAGPAGNLPTRLPHLVGRTEERKLIRLYLGEEESRIVSIVGPGGMGKTTLALHAANDQREAQGFLHGVFFVSLDSVPSADLISTSIAEALGCPLQGSAPPDPQVIRFISTRHLLLVLDNLEHLTDGAGFLQELLQGCPNLKLLITSRERLHLADEWIIGLQGLAIPPDPPAGAEEALDPEQALAYDSVALFTRHAQRARPGFVLDATNADSVAAVCRFVRGHPLAIELAASWARDLSPARIAEELQRGYDFLASRNPAAKHRHLSIRAVFEHSWELLEPPARDAVKRLSAFRGSFTPDAAESVARTPLPVLAGLVDKSLLQAGGDERFEQHPLLRGYGREKLAGDPDTEREVLERHADYYLALLERHAKRLRGPEQGRALAAIEAEIENVRLAWDTKHRARDVAAVSLAAEPIRTFFDLKGRAAEGGSLLQQARASFRADDPAQRRALGHLMAQQAWLTLPTGDVDRAAKLARGAVRILRELGEHRGLYWAVNSLGAAAGYKGSFAEAKRYFEVSLRLARGLKDSRLLSVSLDNLGGAEQALGNDERARERYEAALAIARKDENTGQIITTLNNLGVLLVKHERPRDARPLLEEGYRLAKRSGAQRFVPFFLANLGEVNHMLGEHRQAARAYRAGIRAAREASSAWLECALTSDLARVAADSGDLDLAQRLVGRSLELAENLRDTPLFLHAAACLAEALRHRDEREARRLARIVLRHPNARIDDKAACARIADADPDAEAGRALPEGWREEVHRARMRMRRDAPSRSPRRSG